MDDISPMIISPSIDALNKLVRHQIDSFFILEAFEDQAIEASMPKVLERLEKCFSESKNKYYEQHGEVFFSIYQSAQYCIFLYMLSNQIHQDSPKSRSICDKIYYLNKALNGLDLYFEVEMPEIFRTDHPVGSVMGRASYGHNFSFVQCCTVGNNKGLFPTIGANVTMFSGSKILGNSTIGDNVLISANTYIKDADVPADCIVFGSSPNLVFKPLES